MKATLISTEGSYLEARVMIDNTQYFVMDEMTIDERTSPKAGDEFDIEIHALLGDDEWDEIFHGNPKKLIGLEHIDGWKYKAFGKVIAINPVVVDCGLYQEEDVFSTNDSRVIGEYISFNILRLGAYAI